MSVSKKEIMRGISKVLFELTIVFFGVLLAFIASDWNTKIARQDRFEKTLNVLQQEISDFITYSPVPIQAMQDSLDQYLNKHTSGKYPTPAYYREPRAARAPTAAWEAMLASGSYEILDPTLFYEMTIYYNRVSSFNTKFSRYMVRCEDWILTKLGQDNTVFYDNGKLKGEFRLQIQMLEEIISDLKNLGSDAQALKSKLELQFPTD